MEKQYKRSAADRLAQSKAGLMLRGTDIRNKRICAFYEAGSSKAEIARMEGLCKQRIAEIIRRQEYLKKLEIEALDGHV